MTRTALLLTAATAMASHSQAQSISFDRLALHLTQGDRVTIIDANGQEVRGRLLDLSSSTLSLQIDELRRDFDRTDISVIRRPERDSLKDGALIGFVSGVVLSVSIIVARYGAPDDADDAGHLLRLSSWYGAAGAGVGIALDALYEESRIVYQNRSSNRRTTVSPVLTPSLQGLWVSLRF